MKNIKRRNLIIIAIVIIVFVGLVIYLLQKKPSVPTQIFVTTSAPAENASGVSVFNPIMVTFNQSVDANRITVNSDPTEDWIVKQTTSNTIEIDHQLYLHVATTYTLKILDGNNIIETLSFETAHDQNDPRQLQEIQTQLNIDYPLGSLTPYQTSDYRVVYSAPLTLEIDIASSSTLSPTDAITQVKQWVTLNGVDPATHKYITKIVSSTPQP